MTSQNKTKFSLCIVIPCYNEGDYFLHDNYVNFLKSKKDTLLCFVNDGSKDDTQDCIENLQDQFPNNVVVVNHKNNNGKAAAVKTGMNFCANKLDYDYIAYLDADLAVSLDECYQLTHHFNENIDFVFGSRVLRIGANIVRKATRHYIGRIIATLISNILGLKVYDSQCGCKLFKKDLSTKIFKDDFISRWLFDVEIFFRILNLYHKKTAISKMKEIPLESWIDRGDSKVKLTYFFKLWVDLLKIKKRYKSNKVEERFDFSDKKTWVTCLVFFISTICFHVVYNIKTIIPTNINWLLSAYHDWGQHYLGWTFYRDAPWTFPLGEMNNYYYPIGTNIGFTDSIPLLALVLKPISAILPEDFQYFGFFMYSAFLLSAYFTLKILRLYKVNWIYNIFAIVFVVTSPLFIFRGMHPALTAHWLIIASIYLYLKPSLNEYAAKNNKKQLFLFFLSCTIHPYLAAMVFGFCILLPIKQYYFDKSVQKKHLIFYPILSLFSGLFFWYILGMIGFNEGNSVNAMGLYGESSFNLNSFYNSFYYYSKIFSGLPWVNIGQHEGFSYLGFGMIIISTISILYFIVKKHVGFLKSIYTPLVIFITILLLFAISNIVTFGDKVLFEVSIPKFLKTFGGIFRGSGRFCWPFYYVFVIFSLILFSKIFKNKIIKTVLIASLLTVQLYDIQTILTNRDLKLGTYQTKLDDETWKNVFSNFDEIITYPPFQKTLLYNFDYQDLMYLANKVKKPISTGYVARSKSTQEFVDSLNIAINSEDKIDYNKSLFVTTPEFVENFKNPIVNNNVSLQKLDGFYLIYDSEKKFKNLEFKVNNKAQDSIKQSLKKAIKEKSSNYIILDNIVINDKNEVRFGIDEFLKTKNTVKIRGWAFDYITNNNEKDSVFISFTGKQKSYLFNTKLLSRPDVTSYFKRENLDMSGFDSLLFLDELPSDYYKIGFVIKSDTVKAYKQTEYFINKTD